MATFQVKPFLQEKDPETECVRGHNDYEECRQNYFLRQQNQILQSQQSASQTESENAQLKTEMETLRQELEMLKTQQVSPESDNGQIPTVGFLDSTPLLYIFIPVAVVVVTIFTTKHFIRK